MSGRGSPVDSQELFHGSWNVIGGLAGYPSFATAAFFGLGSYVGALAQKAGVPMVLAWVVATVFVKPGN